MRQLSFLFLAMLWVMPLHAKPLMQPHAKAINMEFKDAQISDVIRVLSEASGLNIVATNEAAQKRVTLYLHEVSAHQAMEIVSKISGLWYRYDEAAAVYR